jgi:Sortase domain
MPRWLTTLILLVLFFGFVLPNPAGAGAAVGNAMNSMLVFFKSAGNALTNSSGAGTAGTGGVRVYPRGGVGSGDGTTDDGDGGGAVLLDLGSTPVAAPVLARGSQVGLSHSPPVQLRIPSIGVTGGFVALGLESDGALEVPLAADVVGWYRDAPTPGERGPAVVTAHVDWRHQRGVFHDLGRLKPGDDVTIYRADGVAVTFRVSRVAEYRKTRFPTHEVYGSTDGAELRMITCGGRFDDRTHSYDHNIVVFARMAGVA